MTLSAATAPIETERIDSEANTVTIRVEERMVLPFRVRDLFPLLSADSAGIDFDAASKAPPRPRPVPEPTPLRDFVVARLAELPDSPLLAGALVIVAAHDTNHAHGVDWRIDACYGCGTTSYMDDSVAPHTDACTALRALAAPFADHPDYPELREPWDYWST